MSPAKHTPGDWEVVGNHIRSSMVQEDSDRPRGVMLANVFDGFGIGHSEEAKANTRLMAAAKDLLEALQAALKALDAIGDEMTVGERYSNAGQYLIDALEPSRAAIAKATGSAA